MSYFPVTFAKPTVQKFTSGTSTYNTPTGVRWIKVTVIAGGGGGSGSGSASWGDGGVGGTSSFGTSLLTATGGNPGGNPTLGTAGGTGGGFTINSPAISLIGLNGSEGEGQSPYNSSTVFTSAGNGGPSIAGVTGGSSVNAGSGAGGQGGASSGTSVLRGRSGGGGGGLCAIIQNPAASYSYQVGAGGTAGAAGTNGNAGYAGSSGIIIVEEYYT